MLEKVERNGECSSISMDISLDLRLSCHSRPHMYLLDYVIRTTSEDFRTHEVMTDPCHRLI